MPKATQMRPPMRSAEISFVNGMVLRQGAP
jgi:hypothetical protein